MAAESPGSSFSQNRIRVIWMALIRALSFRLWSRQSEIRPELRISRHGINSRTLPTFDHAYKTAGFVAVCN